MSENIPERFKSLASKLISFKFTIYAVTVLLLSLKLITPSEYTTVTVTILAGHVGMKGFRSFLEGVKYGDYE